MFNDSAYEHTQHGWWHWLIYGNAAVLLVTLCILPAHPVIGTVFPIVVVSLMALAFMFRELTVRDASEALIVEFGPLHVFRKRVAYADIAKVSPARSRFIDGWGIHYGLGEGWIWNISGYDCVRLELKNGRRLRIGTDEPEKLCAFLRTRIRSAN